MPFTFAHPAILLPFRKQLSVTGIFIGCMSPDFEYFLRLRIFSNFSHTFWGIFLFCLPISLIVATLYHQNIRNSFIENSPNYIFSRAIHLKDFNWINYLKNKKTIITLSILIGAFSHILWDSFTHNDGFFVNQFEILKSSITIQQKEISLLKILQHLSTLIGFTYILLVIHRLPSTKKSTHKINLKYFNSIFLLTTCFILPLIKINSNILKLGNLIVVTISCCFISVLITSLIFKNKEATLN